MGVSQQIYSREMSKVMKNAVQGVLCTVIYGMDPAVMVPMISETGILTVAGNDPYSGELNKMIRRGTDDDSVINRRLLDILFSRHKWWIVFIRVCQQCEYIDVIEAIEGKLTATQRSELHRQIQCSIRQRSIDGRAERRDLSLPHRPPDVEQHFCAQSLFPQTMATTPTQRRDLPQEHVAWGGDQWDTTYENRPSNTDRSPGTLSELSQGHMQTPICSSQNGCDINHEGPQGLSLSGSTRQFEKRSSDSDVLDETLAKASTQTTDCTRIGGQIDIQYQNTEMNSNIGRSPGRPIGDEKKINVTKELIHYTPKLEETGTNNLSGNAPYNLRKFKTSVETATNIGWNIQVPDKNAEGPDSTLTSSRESNRDKVGNILSLEKPKIQNHPREDATDTSVVTDDVTNKYTYHNFQHDGVDRHRENREGDEGNTLQESPAAGGSNTVPYASGLIIQTQLDLERKHDGASPDQKLVVVEYESTEKQSLEAGPIEEHRHDLGSRHHHPEETYCTNSQCVKSQDTNTQCDHQLEVMNTEGPNPEFTASVKTDSDVNCVSDPEPVSGQFNPVGNIPNFGLLGDDSIETAIQGDDISPDWIEEETSQKVISDRPGDNTLPTVDNGANATDPSKVMSENTDTETSLSERSAGAADPLNQAGTSSSLQQACSPLRETSNGSVYFSPQYSSRSRCPQVADYTHIPPPAHVRSMSDTSEPPPVHEDLAVLALKQKMEGASHVKPR